MSKKKLRGRADWLDYEMEKEMKFELGNWFKSKNKEYIEIDEKLEGYKPVGVEYASKKAG